MRPKIYVIGVSHPSKKDGKKILRQAGRLCPEAIFIERSKKGPQNIGVKKVTSIFLRNPSFLLGAIIYFAFVLIVKCFGIIWLGEFGVADWVYTNRASKKTGALIHKVDDGIYEMTVSRRAMWSLISWVVLAFSIIWVWLIWVWLSLPISTFPLMYLFGPFLFTSIFLTIFVKYGISTRNQNMMDRIENIIKSGSHKKVFLITGKAHVRDFKKRLSKKFGVRIL